MSGGFLSGLAPATPLGRWLWLWAPVAAFMAVIFAFSGTSSPPSVGVNDKTGHFVGYGTLGAFAVRATAGGMLNGVTGGSAIAAWAMATAYGVTDEYHQSFVPGRTPDVGDVLADAVGAGASIATAWAFGIIARSRRSSGASPRRR